MQELVEPDKLLKRKGTCELLNNSNANCQQSFGEKR